MRRLTKDEAYEMSETSGSLAGIVHFLTGKGKAMPPDEVSADMLDPELWKLHFANVCRECLKTLTE